MYPYTPEHCALLFNEWSREYLIPTLRMYALSVSIVMIGLALIVGSLTAIKKTVSPKGTRR